MSSPAIATSFRIHPHQDQPRILGQGGGEGDPDLRDVLYYVHRDLHDPTASTSTSAPDDDDLLAGIRILQSDLIALRRIKEKEGGSGSLNEKQISSIARVVANVAGCQAGGLRPPAYLNMTTNLALNTTGAEGRQTDLATRILQLTAAEPGSKEAQGPYDQTDKDFIARNAGRFALAAIEAYISSEQLKNLDLEEAPRALTLQDLVQVLNNIRDIRSDHNHRVSWGKGEPAVAA
jgi:hypothetical protein